MKASELASKINAALVGEDVEIESVSSFENVKDNSLVALLSPKLAESYQDCPAAVFLVKEGFDTTSGKTFIVAPDAELALVEVLNILYPTASTDEGISPSAYVADSAIVCEDVTVDPFACIGKRCKIGRGTKIYSNAVIGDDVEIGEDCIIYPNVSIYKGCKLGDRVIIHSGSVIGADGFGYYQKNGQNIKIPHIGGVILEDDVEIGANSCVDRGKFDNTIVGAGTKIDNQVQVAHNVKLGKGCIACGQAAIAGSTDIGDYVFLGARAGVSDHVNICSKVMLAAQAGVFQDIEKPGIYAGFPSGPRKSWLREIALVKDLPNIVKRINELEKKDD